MEKIHVMTLRRSLSALLFSLLALGFLLLGTLVSPLAEAEDYGDSDASSGDITEEQCADLDESLAAALGCDTTEDVNDFTEYGGELEAPDAEGYDEALTETDNARDFIQNIVNYALGFLFLISVVIMIYGGVMYVLSRGDEEMATKGKKSIGYAAIGIVIIMASFPLVNTLFQAGGGEVGGGSDGSGTGGEGTTITETGASFDVDFVLEEIENIAADYKETYDTYIGVTQEVNYLKSVEIPIIVEVDETGYTASGLIEALIEWATSTDSDYADQYDLIDEDDVEDYIDTLRKGVRNIQTQVDSLSDTYEAAQALYDYLRSGANASLWGRLMAALVPQAFADEMTVEEIIQEILEGNSTVEGCATRDYNEQDVINDIADGVTVYEVDIREIDDQICSFIENIQVAAAVDYVEAVGELIDRAEELRELFDTEEFNSGSKLTQIVETFDGNGTDPGILARLEEALTNISANSVRDIVDDLNELHNLVENIEFVRVILSASATEGNAPLIVRFNISGTEDPSGKTVEDTQIEWDLDGGDYDGDGDVYETTLNTAAVKAENITGDAVSATYKEPGTYRVRVRVRSQDEDIAAGISTVSIKVETPKSKIVLTASAGGETTVLADYNNFPAIDQESYKVTMSEALEGVTFDAGATTDGDGNDGAAGGIIYYEWEFGDGTVEAGKYGEEGGDQVTHQYGEEGAYNVSLTVTDDTGLQDRKFLTLYVASPAARLSVNPSSGTVGTTFTFDGSGSSADLGSIVSYQWTASLNGQAVDLESTTGDSITATFDQPGIYLVSLQIADNSGKTDSTSAEILVESTPPVATYEFSIPSSNEPSTVFFDASDSFDPDSGDTLSYDWDFNGTEGENYEILETGDNEVTMTVKFLKEGSYNVTLTVTDQHEGELKKSDTATGTVSIDSILDVKLTLDGETARHLDALGQAEVEFTASSTGATAFEIDYGEGHTDFTDTLTRGESIFTHLYENAGVFEVMLTAFDDNENKNSTTTRVYIGTGDAPIAVISIGSDAEDIGDASGFHGSINTSFHFDASESINVDGSHDNLVYSWNFGDGVTASQEAVTHSFEETAVYTVSLAVRDADDPSVSDETSLQISIEGLDPEIRSLSVVPQNDALETPLKVDVNVDARDEDGTITYVKGWYYDLSDTAAELGTVIAQGTKFTLTVNTKGETGETHEYGFAVEVTDNDNNTVSSFQELDAASTPTLQVVNGPNETPVAGFTVDKTSVYTGEEVTFSSTSYDPDGELVNYWWDIEGDGFYNNDPQENASYVHTFTQVHHDGVNVRLKVEDSAGATAESQAVTIYVDAISAAPDAAFLTNVDGKTVGFQNNSIIDTKNGAELAGLYWDFDLDVDSNGNGAPDDDTDSFEEDPSHTYDALGVYPVKMTVVDSTGQMDSVSQDVNVLETLDPTADFTYSVEDKTVEFTNESTTDTANDVTLRSYAWDMDLNADTDGDTDPENDVDATTKNPTYTYEDYGTRDVRLVVEDNVGKTDSVIKSIDVPSPIESVTALLTSSPQPNSLSQVILEDDGDEVIFYYGAEGGSGSFTYTLDKNIFYDTDGDGLRDNDADYEDNSSGTWDTPFFISYGHIVTKLTVTDTETGEIDIATLQVVFEGSLGGANLFNATPMEMSFLILSALLTVIFGVTVSLRFNRN